MVTTKYEAKDGKQFTERSEANEWDTMNFEMWLDSNPMIDAKHFLDGMGTSPDSYDHTNDKLLAKQLLRQYWDEYVQ